MTSSDVATLFILTVTPTKPVGAHTGHFGDQTTVLLGHDLGAKHTELSIKNQVQMIATAKQDFQEPITGIWVSVLDVIFGA